MYGELPNEPIVPNRPEYNPNNYGNRPAAGKPSVIVEKCKKCSIIIERKRDLLKCNICNRDTMEWYCGY